MFYPLDVAKEFPDDVLGHKHDEPQVFHNGTHNGDFHVHVVGVIPEVGRLKILILMTGIMCYFVYSLFVLIYNTFCQKKIKNSRS